MKEYIDFQATLQYELLSKLRLNSKLKKHWGTTELSSVVDYVTYTTTYLDGRVKVNAVPFNVGTAPSPGTLSNPDGTTTVVTVEYNKTLALEVFNKKFKIWPGEDTEEVKKVLRLFGMKSSDITSQSKDGITALYLTFNPNKIDTSSYNAEALATAIEREVPINEVRSFILNYHDTSDPKKFTEWTKEQILTFFDNNYTTVMRQIGYLEARGDTIVDDTIGMYILLDDGTDFEVTALEAQVVPLPIYGKDKYTIVIDEDEGTTKEVTKLLRYETSISITFEYKRISALNDDSPIVVAMLEENSTQRKLQLQELAISSGYDDTGWIPNVDKTKTNSLWYKNYLRTDIGKNLKSYDYHQVVFGSVDTTYDKKKTKWWKKAIVIIIATIIGALVGGPVGAAQGFWYGVAAGAAAAAIAMTIGSMMLAKMGEYDGATYVGRWAKVAGIISFVAGITAALQSLARMAAEQATAQAVEQAAISASASGTVLTEAAVSSITESVQVGLTDYLSAAGNMAMKSIGSGISSVMKTASTALKVVSWGVERREANKAKILDSMRNEVKEQQKELAEMNDKNLHLGVQDIKMCTNNLRADNICFEVDYLYEGDGVNIQRPSFYKATGLNIIT